MNRLLTLQEIADYLGVKPSTIYSWTHLGQIPYVKVGRLLRFRSSDIDRWLLDRSFGAEDSESKMPSSSTQQPRTPMMPKHLFGGHDRSE